MIKFNKLNKEKPYLLLKKKYNEALEAGQKILKLYQYHLLIKIKMKLIQDMLTLSIL